MMNAPGSLSFNRLMAERRRKEKKKEEERAKNKRHCSMRQEKGKIKADAINLSNQKDKRSKGG